MQYLFRYIITGCLAAAPFLSMAQAQQRASALEQAVASHYTKTAPDLIFYPQATFSEARLQGGFEKGSFRLPQESQLKRYAAIGTSGMKTFRNIRFYGEFDYRREWNDSAAWIVRLDPKNPHPYTFAVQRPGNWQTANYHLNGLASTAIGNKLIVGAGVTLDAGDGSRNNQPSTGITYYQLKFEGNAGWQFSPSAGIAVKGSYGYGFDKTSLDGTATIDQGNKALTLYDFTGYGSVHSPASYRIYNFNRNYSLGVQAYLNQGNNSWRIAGNWQYQRDSAQHTPSSQDNYRYILGKFYRNTWDLQASWLKQLSNARSALLQFDGLVINGRDHNDSLGGNNYRFAQHTFGITAAYYHHKGPLQKNGWLGKLGFTDLQKLDGSTQHTFQASYLEGYLQREQSFLLDTESALTMVLRAGGRTDVGSKLEVPGHQVNVFTENIAFPELRYYQESALSASLRVGYLRQLKNAQMEFSLQPGIVQSLGTNPAPVSYIKFNPEGNRFFINCNLQFYF